MAKRRDSKDVIGGFDALRAARQAHSDGLVPDVEVTREVIQQDGTRSVAHDSPGSRIKRTVMPTRQEIVCLECAHIFELSGRSDNTVCPKCRERLPIVDLTISDEWDDELYTAGTVTIEAGGNVIDGKITANNIILQGKISGGELRASRCITLECADEIDASLLNSLDLKIGAEQKQKLNGVCTHRNVDLAGELEAELELSGSLIIRESGCFKGSYTGPGLAVEEGGGLLADVYVQA